MTSERSFVRRKPCSGCPFSRTGEPSKDGAVDPFALIGQSIGPFVLPCHQDPEYTEKRHTEAMALSHCAGAAIYRSNIGLPPGSPQLHRLPADTTAVFSTPEELVASYLKIPLAEATKLVADMPPKACLARELSAAGVKVYVSERK